MLTRMHEGGDAIGDIDLIRNLPETCGTHLLSARTTPGGDGRPLSIVKHCVMSSKSISTENHVLMRVDIKMADVTFQLNGKSVTAPQGTLLIEVVRTQGIEVRRSVITLDSPLQAACRMCLVDIEKRAEAGNRPAPSR